MSNKNNSLLSICADIFELQSAMNATVNPLWMKAGYPWYRAAWIEAGELADHVNYKWWKNTESEIDTQQAGLELVDIFHFMVSNMIELGYSPHDLFSAIHREVGRGKISCDKQDKLEQIDEFVEGVIATRSVMPVDLFPLIRTLGIDVMWVVKWYVGKNALNAFRQANGYKDGSYVKVWDGAEDNVHLAEIIESGLDTYKEIYEALEKKYSTIVKN